MTFPMRYALALARTLTFLVIAFPGLSRSEVPLSVKLQISNFPSSATRIIVVVDVVDLPGKPPDVPFVPLKVSRDIPQSSQPLTLSLILLSDSAYRIRAAVFKAGPIRPIISASACARTGLLHGSTVLAVPLQQLSPSIEPYDRGNNKQAPILRLNFPGVPCLFDEDSPTCLWVTTMSNAPDVSGVLDLAPLSQQPDGHLAATFATAFGEPGLRYQLGFNARDFQTEFELPLFLWPQYSSKSGNINVEIRSTISRAAEPATGAQQAGSYQVQADSNGKLRQVFVPLPRK